MEKGPKQDTSWNSVAKWYDTFVGDCGGKFHQDIISPEAFSLLKLEKGEKVLDLGCGQGFFSRQLVQQKNLNLEVTGVDKSAQLIALAKQRGAQGINYMAGDATNLSFLKDKVFDKIICILAIQNMDPLKNVFEGCNQHLKKGGLLVIITTHPAFRIPRQSGWGIDEKRKLQYRRVDSYMTEMKIPIIAHPGKKDKIATWTFHRPLQSYINTLSDSGFIVDRMNELVSNKISQKGKYGKAENTARTEIPMFVSIRAIKS
jgi:ubiquinone/menaquinone biosynthesis C-methylase UbiE